MRGLLVSTRRATGCLGVGPRGEFRLDTKQDIARANDVIAEGVTLAFFAADDEAQKSPLMGRHKINRTKQKRTVRRYYMLILKRGMQRGVRELVVVTTGKVDTMRLASISVVSTKAIELVCGVIAGGHLVEAAYMAAALIPENQQVIVSNLAGMPGATVLHPLTPVDALLYFRNTGNDLNNEANGHSFIDMFSSVPTISAAWLATRKDGPKKDAAEVDEASLAALLKLRCQHVGLKPNGPSHNSPEPGSHVLTNLWRARKTNGGVRDARGFSPTSSLRSSGSADNAKEKDQQPEPCSKKEACPSQLRVPIRRFQARPLP